MLCPLAALAALAWYVQAGQDLGLDEVETWVLGTRPRRGIRTGTGACLLTLLSAAVIGLSLS